jgi:hypothetical protein
MTERKRSKLLAVCPILSILLLSSLLMAGHEGETIVAAQSNRTEGSNMTRNSLAKESPLACNVLALDAAERRQVQVLLSRLRASIQEVKELLNGYSFKVSGDAAIIPDVAEYVGIERLCCPFFDFEIVAEKEGGPIWIALTGREGVKQFARTEFDLSKIISTSSSDPNMNSKQSPLACNDGALNAAQMQRLVSLLKEFRSRKQEVKELPDGYAVRLPVEAKVIEDVADYMTIVRLCSPYFETSLRVEREAGPIWLKITGREGAKKLVKAELGV